MAASQVQVQPWIKRHHLKTTTKRAGDVTDLVKMLTPKSDNLSLIPETLLVGDNLFLKAVL